MVRRELVERHAVGFERRERGREILGGLKPPAHGADHRELARLELVRRRGGVADAADLLQHHGHQLGRRLVLGLRADAPDTRCALRASSRLAIP